MENNEAGMMSKIVSPESGDNSKVEAKGEQPTLQQMPDGTFAPMTKEEFADEHKDYKDRIN